MRSGCTILLVLFFAAAGAVPAAGADAVAVLADYAAGFQKSGRRLIMAVIPPRENDAAAEYRRIQDDLHNAGVESIDLTGAFERVAGSGRQVWCRNDHHPAPAAIAEAAATAALYLADFSLPEERRFFLQDVEKAECSGGEILEFVPVAGTTVVPGGSVLVLGDSNVLVYHDGIDMPVRKAGFADYLAYYLVEEVSLLGMRGSCADQLRGELYRKSVYGTENTAEVQTVIFVLSFAQFADGANRWQDIPVPLWRNGE